MNTINHLDLFSGVGGFSLGLREAGVQVDWHGFSDIDKYTNKVFKERFPNAKELGSIEHIDIDKLPRIDIVTFGFPCQDLSIAGRRKGFDGSRSSLFFKAIEIIERKKPKYFVFENVKGFYSSNAGKDFTTALQTVADIGYDGQWQLLNTRWFLPQNRERIYFVGHIRGECRPKVFPIGEGNGIYNKTTKIEEEIYSSNPKIAICLNAEAQANWTGDFVVERGLNQIGVIGKDSEATRVYDTTCARTIKNGGGMGSKTGLYRVADAKLVAKKRNHDTPSEINIYLKKHKDRTLQEIANELDLPKTQIEHYFRDDHYRAIPSPEVWMLLKVLLKFDDTYDKQVTEIYEKEIDKLEENMAPFGFINDGTENEGEWDGKDRWFPMWN